MKRILLIVAMSIILWNCDKDDPGPDLSSATLSLTWNSQPGTARYFAVVSDTSGNVLQWEELLSGKTTDLKYPPDPKLANLTLVYKYQNNGNSFTVAQTYTDIPAGSLTYTEPTFTKPAPDSELQVTITDYDSYAGSNAWLTNDFFYENYEYDETNEVYTFGLYNGKTNDLYVQLSKFMEANPTEFRYKIYPSVNATETITINPEDYDGFDLLPKHNLDYPAYTDMAQTQVVLYGLNNDGTNSGIFAYSWSFATLPYLQYADVPGLFDQYETLVFSDTGLGYAYLTHAVADEPTLSIGLTEGEMSIKKATTQRIEADITGSGEFFMAYGDYGSGSNGIEYDVFSPLSSKVRITLPKFPDDLTDAVPSLAFLKDKNLQQLSINETEGTYKDFYEGKIKGGYDVTPDFMRSKIFAANALSARRTSDMNAILKMYNKKKFGTR